MSGLCDLSLYVNVRRSLHLRHKRDLLAQFDMPRTEYMSRLVDLRAADMLVDHKHLRWHQYLPGSGDMCSLRHLLGYA